jgi:hypothetical protein
VKDIITINYNNKKAFIPTLINKSLTNNNNKLNILIKIIILKLKY